MLLTPAPPLSRGPPGGAYRGDRETVPQKRDTPLLFFVTVLAIVVLDLLTTLSLGGLGGALVSAVVISWERRRRREDPDFADVDALAVAVAAQGKALRRLTMAKVRSYSSEPPAQPDPDAPVSKADLRARAFGRKLQ